ncbi:hypothetical protein KKB99_06505 [bacterium]|nr:hypothetical protein [bacterium]MBU1025640.1 hypothetical protein [bacterium]
MTIFIIAFFSFTLFFHSNDSLARDHTFYGNDRIALRNFTVYQFKNITTSIAEINPGDRIRLIISDNSMDQWTLVKSPLDYMGWVKKRTIDENTREPSLELGEYVSKAEVDLDGDGKPEKIEIIPKHWCWGNDLFINDKLMENTSSDRFCIVDLDKSDDFKELLVVFSPYFTFKRSDAGFVYTYFNKKVEPVLDKSIQITRIMGDGLVYCQKNLPVGSAIEKYILDNETRKLNLIEADTFYTNLEITVKDSFSLQTKMNTQQILCDVNPNDVITLVACTIVESNEPVDSYWSDYYWYQIKTPNGLTGWAEYRTFKDRLVLSSDLDEIERYDYFETASADLNNDGKIENVWIDIVKRPYRFQDYRDDSWIEGIEITGEYTLHINDFSVHANDDDNCVGFKIIDIDKTDNFKEIFVFSHGSCGDYWDKIYRFDGNKIIVIGELYDYFKVYDDYIYNVRIGGDYFTTHKFVLNSETDSIDEIKQDFYFVGLNAQLFNGSLDLYDDKTAKVINAVVKAGEVVEIIAYDQDDSAEKFNWHGWDEYPLKNYWFLVKTQSNAIGWVRLSDMESILHDPPMR